MKRTLLLLTICACGALCTLAADTLTLDLSTVLSSYPQTEDGYWTQTYTPNTPVVCPPFRFSHTGSSEDEGGMAYWDGFTVCTSGDAADYGSAGSSEGWVTRQWGCMAGGGLDAQGKVQPGAPYLVAYWGYALEWADEDYHSLQVEFTDGKPHKVLSMAVCNHPWPYFGNINGDGFAHSFTDEGDNFAVIVHGLNAQGEPTGGTVRHELASFHNGELLQSDQWQEIDLSPLGTVSGLYFTMETTDADELYGANTAVYFCMDRLRILSADEEQQSLARPTGLKADSIGEEHIRLTWSRVEGAESYVLLCNNVQAGTAQDTLFTFASLQPYTSYDLGIIAVAGSDSSETATVTVRTADLTPPAPPANLRAEVTERTAVIRWDAAEDNVEVARYTLYMDGEAYRRTTALSHTVTGLEPSTTYLVEVEAIDLAGNRSARTALPVTTAAGTEALDNSTCINSAPARVYTLTGTYIGTAVPTRKGTYIIVTKDNTTQLIIIN